MRKLQPNTHSIQFNRNIVDNSREVSLIENLLIYWNLNADVTQAASLLMFNQPKVEKKYEYEQNGCMYSQLPCEGL